MFRAISPIAALAHAPLARLPEELLRLLIVGGCALALIMAGNALPL